MSGRYLYCQNDSCGVYLGCSGGNSCGLCGWSSGRDMSEPEQEAEEENRDDEDWFFHPNDD